MNIPFNFHPIYFFCVNTHIQIISLCAFPSLFPRFFALCPSLSATFFFACFWTSPRSSTLRPKPSARFAKKLLSAKISHKFHIKLLTWVKTFTLGTRFAFPFGQRPMVPGFAEGFLCRFPYLCQTKLMNMRSIENCLLLKRTQEL